MNPSQMSTNTFNPSDLRFLPQPCPEFCLPVSNALAHVQSSFTQPTRNNVQPLFDPVQRHDSSFARITQAPQPPPTQSSPHMSPVSVQVPILAAADAPSDAKKCAAKLLAKRQSGLKGVAKRARIKCSLSEHACDPRLNDVQRKRSGHHTDLLLQSTGEIVNMGVRLIVPRNVRLSMMVNGCFTDEKSAVQKLLRATSRRRLSRKSTRTNALQMMDSISRNFVTAKSRIHGRGLFSKLGYKKGEFVVEYLGIIIGKERVDDVERYHLGKNVKECYLFRLPNGDCIDATYSKSKARFLNHCCEPNVTSVPVLVDSEYRIIFYANRDIAPKDELTIDYQFEKEFDPRLKTPCYCKAPSCVGFMN